MTSSARGFDAGPRRSTEVVLNEQSLPLAYSYRDYEWGVVELPAVQRHQRGQLLRVLG